MILVIVDNRSLINKKLLIMYFLNLIKQSCQCICVALIFIDVSTRLFRI